MKLDVIPAPGADPWYAEGLNFTCTQCGNCCTGGPGYVWTSVEEVARLAAFLNLTPQETVDKYCRTVNGRLSLNENRNARGEYDCVFLREERVKRRSGAGGAETVTHTKRSCTVYPARPLQCRTWPFWDGNLASRDMWKRSAQRCPGMNRGKRYGREGIEALRDATDWPENPPTSGAKEQ